MEQKFSDLVEELSLTWWSWMKNDNTCRDDGLSVSDRRKAAEACELLINREYGIIEQMDQYFDES